MPRKPLLLREPPRSRALGLGVAIGSVALCTLAIYPLKSIAPAVSLGVVYLLAVIVVSIFWGLRLGLFTALLSAVAFNFFHLPPTAQFTISDSRNWVALAAFFVVAAIASTLAELARSRTQEAEARRREADLIAELARTLLAAPDVDAALPVAAERIASALELPSAALRRGVAPDHPGRLSLAVTHSGSRLGTLVVPAGIDPENLARLQERLVPGLEALLATAIERESLLRAHGRDRGAASQRRDQDGPAPDGLARPADPDHRDPRRGRGADLAHDRGGGPGRSPGGDHRRLGPARRPGRQPARSLAAADGNRQSRPRTGLPSRRSSRPRSTHLDIDPDRFQLSIDDRLPFIRADAAQLERVFVNLLSNAARYSGGERVSVRAREVSGRVVIRVVDRGPGIPDRDLERIFEAFYRAPMSPRIPVRVSGSRSSRDSSRRTAVSVSVESLPGQGTTFVVEFPWAAPQATNLGANVAVACRTMSQRVLVCDDEMQIRRALRVVLKDAGFEVTETADAAEALDAASVKPPDAAIIDLDPARRRRGGGLPQHPLVERDADPGPLGGGGGGAEGAGARGGRRRLRHQAVRPQELIARLKAALRRAGDDADEPAITADELEIDLAAHTVSRERRGDPPDADRVPPTRDTGPEPRQADDPPGAAGRRSGGPGWEEDTQTLRTHIANLRRKIEPADGPRYIRTDPGVGYRFEG